MTGEFTKEWNKLSEHVLERNTDAAERETIHESPEGTHQAGESTEVPIDTQSDKSASVDLVLPDDSPVPQKTPNTARNDNATKIMDRTREASEPEPLTPDEWNKLIRRGTGQVQGDRAHTVRTPEGPSAWPLIAVLGLLGLIAVSLVLYFSLR